MRANLKTAVATTLSSVALLGGGVIAATPAHALNSYLITTSTMSACQAELNYAVKDLKSTGQFSHSERCLKLKTNHSGGYVYQAEVYYR